MTALSTSGCPLLAAKTFAYLVDDSDVITPCLVPSFLPSEPCSVITARVPQGQRVRQAIRQAITGSLS